MSTPSSGRRRTVAIIIGLLAVAAPLGLAATPASAAPVSVTGGTLTWGVKASFRNYIATIAAGTVGASGGATQAASNGVFTFPVASGSHDAGAVETSATSTGSVHFTGHEGVLDVTLSDVRISIVGNTGSIIVDAVSRPYTPGSTTPAAPVTYDDVTFATLSLAGVAQTSTATAYSAASIPATLTAAGVPIMGGFYPAGTALDPISASLALVNAPTCKWAAPLISAATATGVTLSGLSTCPAATGWRVTAFQGTSSTPLKTVDVASPASTAVVSGLTARSLYRFTLSATNAGGAGPASSYSAWAVPPFKTIDAFTDQQYRDFRLRASTAAERSAWSSKLAVGTLTPVDAVEDAVDFPEWGPKQAPITRLFQAYFLRLPDIGGLNYWTGKSRAGTRINAISTSFSTSSEFTRRYGKLSNKAFVELVYQNVLGRPGDAGGIASWTKKLDTKVKNRGEVMVGFSESNEYKTKTTDLTDVVNVFTGMLRRTPTTSETSNWLTQFEGGATRTTLIAQVLASPAYDVRIS